jgi:hypothetical protein
MKHSYMNRKLAYRIGLVACWIFRWISGYTKCLPLLNFGLVIEFHYFRLNLNILWRWHLNFQLRIGRFDNRTVHQLFIDFEKAYDSVKTEVLYNILVEFGIPKKLVRLIKMCLNETYSRVCVGKLLSDKFPIQNGLKKRCSLVIALQFCFSICRQESPRESGRFGIEWNISAIGLCWRC